MRIPGIALAATAALLALQPSAAAARNIILTNDDGLTGNVVALYRALKDQGHDVIVSVPCKNQSGMGAALHIGRALAPLQEDCRNQAARAGDPGAGPVTHADYAGGDFYYVDGTPVMALLYGLDVVADRRWDAQPDLVLSGPNEGQNVGAIVLSSGTVSNAQFAAMRGLPAIALSGGAESPGAQDLVTPQSEEVARHSVKLLQALEVNAGSGPLMPTGIALNVNFPDDLTDAEWKLTRLGTYNAYNVGFTDNLAETASPTMVEMARERGIEVPPLPGVSFEFNDADPASDQFDDESIVYRQNIAISPMQAGYALSPDGETWLRWQLGDLLAKDLN